MLKMPSIKNFRKKNEDSILDADMLFSTGKIFQIKTPALENLLKMICIKETKPNLRDLIRTNTILNIINSRTSNNVQNANLNISIIILFLTVLGLFLSYNSVKLTEIATRSERIQQNEAIKHAIEFCKSNPQSTNSGMKTIETGAAASCPEVLKEYGI